MSNKGHVFITNNNSYEIMRKHNLHAVFKEDPNKKFFKKTKADILADMSCVREGDTLFFYNTDEKAFMGIYKADSRVFFSNETEGFDEKCPYRILVRPYVSLAEGVKEKDLFSIKDASQLFSSIFYKKVLGRGKACTHLFPEEEKLLTETLFKYNTTIPQPILNSDTAGRKRQKRVRSKIITPKFKSIQYEKELEWWLTHHLDSHRECQKLFGDPADMEVFLNYIPITIAGGNIDLVVYQSRLFNDRKIRYKVSLVELKKGNADLGAIEEIEKYTRWFLDNKIGVSDRKIIKPIIIAKTFSDNVLTACKYWNSTQDIPSLFTYALTDKGSIVFDKVKID